MNLFHGRMVVHIGKREEEDTNSQGPWRMFIVRNERLSETYLLEVPCNNSSLRSRSSILVLNVMTGLLFIWNGAKSPFHIKTRAMDIASAIKKK